MGETIVVHVNDPDGFDHYIGRAARFARDPRAHKASILANPYALRAPHPGHGGPMTLPEALELFEAHLPTIGGDWRDEYRGCRLACWCTAPGTFLTAERPWKCHGQIVAAACDGRLVRL